MYLPFILKEVTKRKSRSIIIILMIAVISSLLILVTVFLNTYSDAIYAPFKEIDANIILQKSSDNKAMDMKSKIRIPFGKDIFSEKEISDISSLNHIKDISKSLVVWQFEKNGFTSIEGIEPENFLSRKYKSWISDGNFIDTTNNKTAVVESHFAKFNHLKIGSTILLNDIKFDITGILKIKEESQIFSSNVYIRINDAQQLSDFKGYNLMYLKLDDISNEDSIKNSIKKINGKINAISGNTISSSLGNITNIYQKFYFLGLAIITSILILILTKITSISLFEKSRDIGILQSVGWTSFDIIRQIVLEMEVKIISGFIIGSIFSFCFILILKNITLKFSSIGLEAQTSISVPISFSPFVILIYFTLIGSISGIVAYILARKMAYMKPVKNLVRL